ncbi:MAG: formylglycine-generating enzyme family protein [Polyangiaceae bacterium]|nr:formylglycine-generating enzyme family protein [Polyangiaceae bacterium]
MNSHRFIQMLVLAFTLIALALSGCAQKEEVRPDPGGANNLTSAPPDQGEWACPDKVSGAPMVLIPVDEGNPYCIDARQTTYGEYKQFVEAKGNDFSGQPPECDWNDDYGPKPWRRHPAAYDIIEQCGPTLADANPNHAVRCLDFCDAWAYCSWAGKRLCGVRGEANGKVSKYEWDAPNELAKSVRSEWFNVCSQAGTSQFAYGNEEQTGICAGVKTGAETDVLAIEENACHGSRPPYDQVFDMTGVVGEWINICYDDGGGCGAHAIQLRSDFVFDMSCAANFHNSVLTKTWYGVRCCADAAIKQEGKP